MDDVSKLLAVFCTAILEARQIDKYTGFRVLGFGFKASCLQDIRFRVSGVVGASTSAAPGPEGRGMVQHL